MPSVLVYHRPESLDEASTLLAEPNRRAVGGGTVAVPQARQITESGVEVVDLQALGLDRIEVAGNRLRLGAMVRLGDLTTDPAVPALIADLARRELPSALRNQATVGGTVALADDASVLLAGLLAHDTTVQVHGSAATDLADLLATGVGRGLITSMALDPTGAGTIAATGRTPADEPIVAAIAREAADGPRLALTGVAPTPILVDPPDPTAGLSPRADFRGSSEYRIHLAGVLSARALAGVA